MKRAFDLAAAIVGSLALAPLLALLAAAVLVADGRPVFFRQERVGRHGRPFRIWKYRTMRADAERRGGQLTVGADPRVTRLGAVLRRTKLDELPQLLNVIAGEMSLVGPRPEVPRYVAHYSAEQRELLRLRPGVTDPASLAFSDEAEVLARADDPESAYLTTVMPAKLRLNREYAARATLLSDVGVIARTLLLVAAAATGRRPARAPVAEPGAATPAVR